MNPQIVDSSCRILPWEQITTVCIIEYSDIGKYKSFHYLAVHLLAEAVFWDRCEKLNPTFYLCVRIGNTKCWKCVCRLLGRITVNEHIKSQLLPNMLQTQKSKLKFLKENSMEILTSTIRMIRKACGNFLRECEDIASAEEMLPTVNEDRRGWLHY